MNLLRTTRAERLAANLLLALLALCCGALVLWQSR